MNVAVRENEPLARHTSFRIGGPADVWLGTRDQQTLARVLRFCRDAGVRRRVLGRGSNVLVSDQGLRGVVVVLDGQLARVAGETSAGPGRVTAGAGASLDEVVNVAEQAGLSGVGFLAGIPGTVGGALMTNAGAFGRSLSDAIECISGLDSEGKEWTLARDELRPRYREPLIDDGLVATRVSFRLDKGEARPGADVIRRQRRARHPNEPSAGSFFKNPTAKDEPADGNRKSEIPRVPAGRLIEQCGLKGTAIGGAKVSEKHANFIVNTGGARFADVYELAQLVKARVETETGIVLEEEVRVLPGPAAKTAGSE
jgi:UDP-N-acetylmuramate dehydrogenase